MARCVAWAFAVLLLVPVAGLGAECERNQSAAAKPDPGHQPPKWWIESKLRGELGITDQQSAAIEAIWEKGLPQRMEARGKLDKLEAQLDQMMLDASADEGAIMAQIDRVESARTDVSKARMLVLYRINKVLTPEQRARLAAKAKAMREQRDGRGDHR